VMVVQVLFTNVPIHPYPDRLAMAQAILADPSLAFERFEGDTAVSHPILFTFTVDGDPVYTQTIDPDNLRPPKPEPIVAEQELTPGSHHITLSFDDGTRPFILFDRTVDIAPGQVYRMGYDPGRTGDCFGATCLKMELVPTKNR